MPLYNCFSDNACAGLSFKVHTSTTTATFNSSDSNYKIYSLPIMLGQKYTIAIDCNFKVEICCAVIGKYLNNAQLNVPMISYKAYNSMNFNKPELYDTSALLNIDGIDNYESDIRMLIKLPINNSSSIVVLEGDYLK